jgi:hypothetical protein
MAEKPCGRSAGAAIAARESRNFRTKRKGNSGNLVRSGNRSNRNVQEIIAAANLKEFAPK